MLQKASVLILFGVLMCRQVPVGAGEPKAADDVIAKHIEAIGGRKTIDGIKSMRVSGKSLAGGGMEIPITIEYKKPNKVRMEFTFQGMTGIRAYDGQTGWFVMPFAGKTEPEKMSADQVEMIEDNADPFGPLVDYKKKGHQVELVGKDEIEGSEVYKLKVTTKSGNTEYYFLDTEHFLPIQTKGKRKFQGTEIEYTVSYGDYKEVGGLLLAHSIQQGGMGGDMTFEKVEVNVDIPDDHFTMPKVEKQEAETTDKEKPATKDKQEPPTKDEG